MKLCDPDDLLISHTTGPLGHQTVAMDCDGNHLFTTPGHITDIYIKQVHLRIANEAYRLGFKLGEQAFRQKVRALLID